MKKKIKKMMTLTALLSCWIAFHVLLAMEKTINDNLSNPDHTIIHIPHNIEEMFLKKKKETENKSSAQQFSYEPLKFVIHKNTEEENYYLNKNIIHDILINNLHEKVTALTTQQNETNFSSIDQNLMNQNKKIKDMILSITKNTDLPLFDIPDDIINDIFDLNNTFAENINDIEKNIINENYQKIEYFINDYKSLCECIIRIKIFIFFVIDYPLLSSLHQNNLNEAIQEAYSEINDIIKKFFGQKKHDINGRDGIQPVLSEFYNSITDKDLDITPLFPTYPKSIYDLQDAFTTFRMAARGYQLAQQKNREWMCSLI